MSLSSVNDDLIKKISSYTHKTGVNSDDWKKVHPNLLVLASYVCDFCDSNVLPLIFTSIIRPKIKDVSISNSHQEGRAFDISVNLWRKSQINDIVEDCNSKFSFGAISSTDGQEREAVYEGPKFKDGYQIRFPHLHFQVRK